MKKHAAGKVVMTFKCSPLARTSAA